MAAPHAAGPREAVADGQVARARQGAARQAHVGQSGRRSIDRERSALHGSGSGPAQGAVQLGAARPGNGERAAQRRVSSHRERSTGDIERIAAGDGQGADGIGA